MSDVRLPDGFEHLHFAQLDSTNAEAFRQAAAGHRGRLWITADTQKAGRGRCGRPWVSVPGNFFASLLLTLPHFPGQPPPGEPASGQHFPGEHFPLSLTTGIAIYEAILDLAGQQHIQTGFDNQAFAQQLCLKWPNDVLWRGQKLAGVLVETRQLGAAQHGGAPGPVGLVIGVEINIVSHPALARQPATDLRSASLLVTPKDTFGALAQQLPVWLGCWEAQTGGLQLFGKAPQSPDQAAHGDVATRQAIPEELSRAWLARATAAGTAMSVHDPQGAIVKGRFQSVTRSGELLLLADNGCEQIIRVGDVTIAL